MQKKREGRQIGSGMVPSTTEIGTFLRSRRLELGLSQVEIAERAGMRQSHYSALEIGRLEHRSLSNHMDRLAGALECEVSVLRALIPVPQEPKTVLGKLIHSLRQRLCLEIEDVAKKAGIDLKHLRALEVGDQKAISYATARKLAPTLGVEVSAFTEFIYSSGIKTKEIDSPLGIGIRNRRRELLLSICDVASSLQVSRQLMSKIERGKIFLRNDPFLVRLASVLDIDPEELRRLRPKRKLKAVKKESIEPGSLAEFVFGRRLEVGLTQNELAIRTGVKGEVIYLIERGSVPKRISALFWERLGAVLGCATPPALTPPARAEKITPVPAEKVRREITREMESPLPALMPRPEDLDRIKELTSVGADEAARKGVQLLRRLLEKQHEGFSLFFAKDGDLVELELLL